MGYENCGTKETHPYGQWLDGAPHVLEAGRDYPLTLNRDHFIRTVRAAAARRGLRVTAACLGLRKVRIQTVCAKCGTSSCVQDKALNW